MTGGRCSGGGSSTDPVDELRAAAEVPDEHGAFRATGVMMQYYEVCHRELWFASRNVEIDRDQPSIVRGTTVDESAYTGSRRQLPIGGTIVVDLLENGDVVEVKPSSKLEEAARLQLLYYLWYLEEVVGVEKDGVLAHPTERSRERVELTDQNRQRIEEAIRGVHDVVARSTPPPAEEKPFCEACAYHDFCWSC